MAPALLGSIVCMQVICGQVLCLVSSFECPNAWGGQDNSGIFSWDTCNPSVSCEGYPWSSCPAAAPLPLLLQFWHTIKFRTLINMHSVSGLSRAGQGSNYVIAALKLNFWMRASPICWGSGCRCAVCFVLCGCMAVSFGCVPVSVWTWISVHVAGTSSAAVRLQNGKWSN